MKPEPASRKRDRKRVVVTGMGVVSSLGDNLREFWEALCDGRDGIGPITVCDLNGMAVTIGGEVKNILATKETVPGAVQNLDRSVRLAVAAASEACSDAGFDSNYGGRTAVVLASNFGASASIEKDLGANSKEIGGDPGYSTATDVIATWYGCRGPAVSLSLSCSSGAAAIGYGAELIRTGRADRVIAGGYDAISRFAWSGLCLLRTMTQGKIRPFDLNRDGTLFSEGAAIMVLESAATAIARNARIYAELAGFGYNANAHHMTAPAIEGRGLADAMRAAIIDAGLDVSVIGHINTHGTGTKPNDLTETQAIKSVFGEQACNIPITSIKSMTGHLMGAAGAAEAIASVMSLCERKIPPTINYETPDPECDLPIVTGEARKWDGGAVLTNSSGIGGNNACLVFSKNGGEA
jgi:3-oxoacyl-[acyl-carrier-protein] synthase II